MKILSLTCQLIIYTVGVISLLGSIRQRHWSFFNYYYFNMSLPIFILQNFEKDAVHICDEERIMNCFVVNVLAPYWGGLVVSGGSLDIKKCCLILFVL